ncbi:MAG: pyrroloquinoline quinone-dependent dehydrogenase [Pseudomonadales bacterium]
MDKVRIAARLTPLPTAWYVYLSFATLLPMLIGCGQSTEIDYSGPIGDWPGYGGSLAGLQYSPLNQVNTANVGQLQLAWEYRFPPTNNAEVDAMLLQLQVQPIVVDNTLYSCTPTARVFALDANNGQQRWLYDYQIQVRPEEGYPTKCRGVAYWADESDQQSVCHSRIFVANADSELIALDADTGKPCVDFGKQGKVFLYEGVGGFVATKYGPTSAPMVVGDRVVVGARVDDNLKVKSPSGVIRAYDVRSGALRWAWNPVAPGVSAYTRNENGEKIYKAGTVNSWAPMSADVENGLVYVPTGNPSPDLYGGHRQGEDYYGSSVVALDAETGDVRWHFQTVHHDVWDYDVPSIPALFQVPGVGDGRLALAQPTKLGHIFLLNRLTGEPLYPVEERPVPQGGVVGEKLSPTQPFPTHPASIHPPKPQAWGFTPFDEAACEKEMAKYRWDGQFTPPSLRGSLQFPGTSGGINWGSSAIDPKRGVLLVNQSHLNWVIKLIPRDEMKNYNKEEYRFPDYLYEMAGTPYGALRFLLMSPLGAPCAKTPWGTLTAVDLKSGDILWQSSLGTTRDLAPWPLWLGIGTPNFGGVLATAGGLTFSTGTTDHFVRAFNTSTGEEIWTQRTDGSVWATPMTYRVSSQDKQFVVFAVSTEGKGEHRYKLAAYALAP